MSINLFYKTISAVILAIVLSGPALALETPTGGPLDKRIRFINYKSEEVVMITGHYGFSTHIQFSPSESISNIAMGDTEAWQIAPIKNHVFIKPIGDKAETNMTIITSRRVYNFELNAHWSKRGAHPIPNDMLFQVSFRYPEDEAARLKSEAEAKKLTSRLNQSKKSNAINWNYWGKGSLDATPTCVNDDGRFTYLTFSNNKEMPAIYIVNSDDSESLVNTSIDPNKSDTIIIHKIARRFILRKGNYVACLFNESFDPNGVSNTTGTITPGVERVIKRGDGNVR